MFLNWLREREKDEDVPEKVILTKLCTQYYLQIFPSQLTALLKGELCLVCQGNVEWKTSLVPFKFVFYMSFKREVSIHSTFKTVVCK